MKDYSLKVLLPTLKVPKKEYGIVYHAINDYYFSRHYGNKIIHEFVDGYVYTAENNGYNDYRIVRKREIKWQTESYYMKNYWKLTHEMT